MVRSLFAAEKSRFITATLLLAVVIGVGWIDNYFIMWLFFGLIYLLAFHEAIRLYGVHDDRLYSFAALIWLAAYFIPDPSLLFLAAVLFASIKAYRPTIEPGTFLPFLYPTASFLFLLQLYTDYGIHALFWLLAIVAASDVGAWFVGKTIGRTPFSPTSPNKTIEGVAGALLIATIVGFFAGATVIDPPESIFISFCVSLAAIFGDLYESYLKRQAGVKDSGAILPGHGGILDRVDGYLFGAIVMVLLMRGLL